MFKNVVNKVNNLELVSSLKKSIQQNDSAIDFVENQLNSVKDSLAYNPDDELCKEALINYEYILFSLRYLDDQFSKTLKQKGGKL